MYIAGRLRTASRPSRTAIEDESYVSFLFFSFDDGVANSSLPSFPLSLFSDDICCPCNRPIQRCLSPHRTFTNFKEFRSLTKSLEVALLGSAKESLRASIQLIQHALNPTSTQFCSRTTDHPNLTLLL